MKEGVSYRINSKKIAIITPVKNISLKGMKLDKIKKIINNITSKYKNANRIEIEKVEPKMIEQVEKVEPNIRKTRSGKIIDTSIEPVKRKYIRKKPRREEINIDEGEESEIDESKNV